MQYSEKIKILREKMLLTQKELAKALGVTNVTICRWETGKCEPTMKDKKAIRKFIEGNNVVTDNEDD